MKISYNWLKQFLNIDLEAEKIADLLTNIGLEVDSIVTFNDININLEGVIVGEVITCVKHPNADNLKITSVNIGNLTVLQIICGSSIISVGQKVAVASIGSKLYDKNGNIFTIKKGKISKLRCH